MQLEQDVLLAPLTSMRVGGRAQFFVNATTERAVVEAVEWASARAIPLHVLGGGSNVVVPDDGMAGLVLRVAPGGIGIRPTGERVDLTASAGEVWDDLVQRTVDEDLPGIEAMSGIPGLVGATPIQNVGAYGQQIADVLVSVRAFDRAERRVASLTAEECAFAYRDSRFKARDRGRFIVLAVTLRLRRGGEPEIRYPELESRLADLAGGRPTPRDVRNAVLAIRRGKSMVLDETDPNGRSCGSFFVNPIVDDATLQRVRGMTETGSIPAYAQPNGSHKLSAAWLIERSGLRKGERHCPSPASD
jgi:UDP-N-acetylmuramate dehydrogenase